jgi:2-(1,2-epoxy-1,2-dihydrophenyl)acetyl-CoA isomerase
MSELLLVERIEHTAILTINRPERRNALGFGTDGVVFRRVVGELNEDRSLRCVILTGCDGVFSAGGDLKQLREWANDDSKTPRDFLQLYQTGIHEVVRALWSLEMPVVAAVNGAAIGLGNDLACLADIRLAGESAKFGATFLKIGLIPGDGGAWLLPKIIGWERAAQLYFAGDIIDAPTAASWGLVSRCVPDAQLLPEAMALARKISQQPPESLRNTKKLMRAGIDQRFEDIMAMSAKFQVFAHLSQDHHEALEAIFEKRPAIFTGH